MFEIKFISSEKRAVIYDNDKIIGECDFLENGDIWNIIHTIVYPQYQGCGLARKLVEKIIEEAKKNHKQIIADCSYAKKILISKK